MEAETAVEWILSRIPILQMANIILVTLSIIPLSLVLGLLCKVALHANCKFIMYAWSIAFAIGVICHIAYIVTDFLTSYLPLQNNDPPYRLTILSIHGFSHVLSSTQEFLFAADRATASYYPLRYHDGEIGIKYLVIGETLSIVCALVYTRELYYNRLISGFLLTTTIDVASLVCLIVTTCMIRKKVRGISGQTLNVKYQLRETSEITGVMLQCGFVSLITKLCAMGLAWTAVYHIFSEKYAITIAAGGYLVIETSNCLICCTALLHNHEGFRRQVLRMIGRKSPVAISSEPSETKDIYFNELRRAWNA